MNKETLAEMLNGNEYRDEISKEQAEVAKEAGLIVIFGYSDDNVMLEGAVSDEVGAFQGTEFYIRGNKFIDKEDVLDNLDDDYGYEKYLKSLVNKDLENSKVISARYDKVDGYIWFITTEMPLAPFDIMEDGEKFCRGIVIDKNDLG